MRRCVLLVVDCCWLFAVSYSVFAVRCGFVLAVILVFAVCSWLLVVYCVVFVSCFVDVC